MRIYNTDGTESAACGNGTRCVAWAMTNDPAMRTHKRRPGPRDRVRVYCRSGVSRIIIFTVDMGEPRFDWSDIPLARPFADTRAIAVEPVPGAPELAASFGGEHGQSPRDLLGAARSYDLAASGRLSKTTRSFRSAPISRWRSSLARSYPPSRVGARRRPHAGLRSAACATVVAASRKGLTGRSATCTLPGGDLDHRWREADGHVLMTGPVELEHEGDLSAGPVRGGGA